MYLRKSKKKNGRVYLTIVEAYRDERGKNMSRTVESLGYVDDLERSGILTFAAEKGGSPPSSWENRPPRDDFSRRGTPQLLGFLTDAMISRTLPLDATRRVRSMPAASPSASVRSVR